MKIGNVYTYTHIIYAHVIKQLLHKLLNYFNVFSPVYTSRRESHFPLVKRAFPNVIIKCNLSTASCREQRGGGAFDRFEAKIRSCHENLDPTFLLFFFYHQIQIFLFSSSFTFPFACFLKNIFLFSKDKSSSRSFAFKRAEGHRYLNDRWRAIAIESRDTISSSEWRGKGRKEITVARTSERYIGRR